jgi:hypothetical protein
LFASSLLFFLVPPLLYPVSAFSVLSLLVYGLLPKRPVVSVCLVIDLVALAAAQQVVVGRWTNGRTEAQAVAATTGAGTAGARVSVGFSADLSVTDIRYRAG